MRKLFFLVTLLAVAFWTCTTKSKTDASSDTFFIDLEITDSLRWEDLFQGVEVIPLEFTDKSMLTGVDEILIQDGYYLIFDQKAQVLYKFDHEGKYLSKLDKSGEGSDEYQLIYDVSINPYSGNIELLSGYGSFFIYDKNFQWVETIDFPEMISASKFDYFSEDVIILYSQFDREYTLRLYSRSEEKHLNKMNQPTKSVFENNNSVTISMLNNPLINTPDGLFFCIPFYNSVYRIGLDGLEFDYQWDFGKYVVDEGGIKKDDPEEKIMEQGRKIIESFSSLLNLYENEKFILVQYYLKGKLGTILYHKESQKYKILYDYVPDYSLVLLSDGIVGPTNSMRLQTIDKLLKNSNSGFAIEDKVNGAEESNPFLLKYTFANDYN
ncbi:6-bladed beta-propeller [Algoriphagus sp. NG3]|uniref:6-bladed beta-propeller n=1 Tax=Algoriphagus sp. NG3 TaxID=3097546 RepID=UPI002A80E755|nr:6-bladed beta-propeller [Algoriphagus sp. NG3]WPR75044.1 6-bladed beta-propeller [Algoriphagus sp. NG3]